MDISRLEIRQQYARISINTEKPILQIKQKKAELDIVQPDVKLEIQKKEARVEIDNYPHRRDLHMRNLADFRQYNKQLAREAVLETIACYAENGDQLMAIENRENALYQVIVRENTPPEKEVTLELLSPPRFHFVPGELRIEVKVREADTKVRLNPPEYNFIRGQVRIGMEQYNHIEIRLRGERVNRLI